MRRWRFIIAVSVVQSMLLWFHLGRQALWLDEMMSLTAAQSSWRGLLGFFKYLPEQHPLYYIVLRAWLVFGSSDTSLRLLSALFAVGTVWVFYLLMSRLADEQTARVAAVLMALSPFCLYYGQEARMYALLGFLTVLNSLFFWSWQHEGGRRMQLWYLGSAVCGVYTHLFFWLVLLAQLVFLLLRDGRRRGAFLKTLATQAVVGVCYVPWALLLVARRPQQQAWKGAQQVIFGIPYTLLRFSLGYSEFLANAGWKDRVWALLVSNAPLLALAGACFGVLCVAGCRAFLRAKPQGWFVLCGLAVPMLAVLLASPIVILMGERYFMVSFPFYVALIAMGFVALFRAGGRARALGVVVAVAYALVLGRTMTDYYFDPAFGKEQWKTVADLIHEHERSGDLVVVHMGYALDVFARYYGPAGPERVLPSDQVSETTLQSSDRLWLVLAHADDGDRYWRPLIATHQVLTDSLLPHQSGIRVLCLTRRSASAPGKEESLR